MRTKNLKGCEVKPEAFTRMLKLESTTVAFEIAMHLLELVSGVGAGGAPHPKGILHEHWIPALPLPRGGPLLPLPDPSSRY